MKHLIIGDEFIISQEGNDNVAHPLFGNTTRMGWAKMKRGSEHTFLLNINVIYIYV